MTHRPYVLKAESWSAFAGQFRMMCQDCNERGVWHETERAAHLDCMAHMHATNQVSE